MNIIVTPLTSPNTHGHGKNVITRKWVHLHHLFLIYTPDGTVVIQTIYEGCEVV